MILICVLIDKFLPVRFESQNMSDFPGKIHIVLSCTDDEYENLFLL